MSGLVFRPSAEEDAEEAALWYERQRPGLGSRFPVELGAVLHRIREAPLQFPRVSATVRRAMLGRFPYAVYFVIEEEVIVLLAILHMHRHPDTWKERPEGAG